MVKILIFFSLFYLLGDKKNLNEIYIENELLNLDQLVQKGKFFPGKIYNGKDTTHCEILKFGRRKDKNFYLFCVAKIFNDSITVFMPDKIDGYCVDDEYFKSHISENGNFFLHLRKTGKATLFERIGLPDDNRFLFYIKLPTYTDYLIICPSDNSVTTTSTTKGNSGNSTRVDYSSSNNTDEKFKAFVYSYLGDCRELRNMVQSGFITINNIPNAIEMYNNCNP